MADPINFKIVQGDTFRLGVTCQNEDGTPIDLSQSQVMFQVKNDFGGKVICATATIGNGIYMLDAVNGKFKIEVSSSQFALPKSAYQIKIALLVEDIEKDGDTIGSGYIIVEKGTI